MCFCNSCPSDYYWDYLLEECGKFANASNSPDCFLFYNSKSFNEKR